MNTCPNAPANRFLRQLLLAILLAACPVAQGAHPNIVLIVADDLGFMDVGYNNSAVYTPRIDDLVATGMKLDHHYVMPQCTPTRVALLTGRYPSRFGSHAQQATNVQVLPLGTPTLASMLGDVGYHCALAGKWHVGSNPAYGPNKYGFDESYGSLAGAVGMYDHRYRPGDAHEIAWHRNHVIIDGYENGEHATDLVAREAMRFIQRKHTQPFFLFLPFHAPHTPLDERGPFIDTPTQLDPANPSRWLNEDQISWFNDPAGKIQAEPDPEKRLLLAVVHHLDDAIGKIVDTLDQTGQRRNTLILFTSDNGPQINWSGNAYPDDLKLTDFNQPDTLRGSKTDVYEGGIRVPAFANWPGTIAPGVSTNAMHCVDWFPTIANLIEADIPDWLALDGEDVWDSLTSGAATTDRRFHWVWGSSSNRRALRDGAWKITRYQSNDWKLFNVVADPDETTDLANTETNKLAELQALFTAERARDVASIQPTPTLSGPAVAAGSFNVELTFPAAVTNLMLNDVALSGATITGYTGSATAYTLHLVPTNVVNDMTMTIQLPGAVAQYTDGRDTLPSDVLQIRYSTNAVAALEFGPLNRGAAGTDGTTGAGYLLYSAENVHTRFSAAAPNAFNAHHFIVTRYENGNWQYDNNTTFVNFTPASNDLLVAQLDFDANTAVTLQGTNTSIQGIAAGYAAGDLLVLPDQWNGAPNTGEFDLRGSYIQQHDDSYIGAPPSTDPTGARIYAPWATDASPYLIEIDLLDFDPNTMVQLTVSNGSLLHLDSTGRLRRAEITPAAPGTITATCTATGVVWHTASGSSPTGIAQTAFHNYSFWANAIPADPRNPHAREPNANFDQDSQTNEQEFVFGGDPTKEDLPTAHYRRMDAADWGIQYHIEYTTDLSQDFQPAPSSSALNPPAFVDFGSWGTYQVFEHPFPDDYAAERVYTRVRAEVE